MIPLAVVVAVLFVLLWRYISKYLGYRALFNSLTGEPSFSYLLGSLHKYPGPNEEGIEYDFAMSKKFKYMHNMWMGPLKPLLMLYHPDSIRPVLKSSAPKPRGGLLSTAYDMGSRWLGEGLLNSNGPRWVRNRRLLTPAFHFDILKSYIDVYNECSNILVSQIKKLSSGGQSFDLFEPVGLCALDVIQRCAFSYHSDCQTKGENEYELAMSELMGLWINRNFTPKHFLEWVYSRSPEGKRFYHLCDVVHAVSEDIIDKRRKHLESGDATTKNGPKKIKDFLDTLLTAVDEDGVGLSPLDIRNEVDTFLFAGHDTTTSGTAWTLYHLSQHPEYQEKIYEEVVGILDGRENITWDDIHSMEFTTMCIKEGIRLDTTVPLIQRDLLEDTEIVGHVIPAGTTVCIHLYNLHINPTVWDKPRQYMPERFHPDKIHQMDPFQYIPFSAGSRNCIGQHFAMNEMKLTVANIIRNFKLACDVSKPARRFLTPTLKTESGMMVYAEPRVK
ncbi:unnamed protein product [Candidula unifasciata]|uniref:Cytochrome P450 family 4 n=1 Tax=Candidula unifasciata TaxID=100452 RepID=A0A8S3ZG32_9EUPU|nr:unnamed protein product [Candidula unifasciata]